MRSFEQIIVTGASGLLGFEVSRVLNERGYPFTTITFSKDIKFEMSKSLKLDLTCSDSVSVLSTLKPWHIIHCAAIIPSIKNVSDSSISAKNILIDKHIIEVCRRTGCKLTYISSTSVYGFPLKEKVTECRAGKDLSLYAQGKLAAEEEIMRRQLDARILRLNAPYGYRQSTRTVLKIFIERALVNEDLKYFGSGKRMQDFTFVGDVAEFIVDSIDVSAVGIFNVSANEPISMKELADLVITLVPGCKSKIERINQRDSQEEHKALYDTTCARQKLNWNPTTDLKSGIKNWIDSINNETGRTV